MCNRGKRTRIGVVRRPHCSIRTDLKKLAVERDHLAIQSLEGAETEVAMIAQSRDAHGAFVDALDQRRRGRYLEQRGMLDLQIVGERGADDMRNRLAGLPLLLFECAMESVRQLQVNRFQALQV